VTESRWTLWTSRYQSFQPEWGAPIPITLGMPKFRLGYVIGPSERDLAPDYAWFNASTETYTIRMIEKFDRFGVEHYEGIFDRHAASSGKTDLVLLCYEDLSKPREFCHRRLFSVWWEEKTGQVVREKGLSATMVGPKAISQARNLVQGIEQVRLFE